MDEEYAKRAERRRRTMVGGIARSHEELDDLDFAYWQAKSPSARLEAAFELVYHHWLMQGGHGDPPRIDRTVGGIRKLRR